MSELATLIKRVIIEGWDELFVNEHPLAWLKVLSRRSSPSMRTCMSSHLIYYPDVYGY